MWWLLFFLARLKAFDFPDVLLFWMEMVLSLFSWPYCFCGFSRRCCLSLDWPRKVFVVCLRYGDDDPCLFDQMKRFRRRKRRDRIEQHQCSSERLCITLAGFLQFKTIFACLLKPFTTRYNPFQFRLKLCFLVLKNGFITRRRAMIDSMTLLKSSQGALFTFCDKRNGFTLFACATGSSDAVCLSF